MAVAHKGSISMGMVLIPIGLYKTTVDNDIHFNQLEKESKAYFFSYPPIICNFSHLCISAWIPKYYFESQGYNAIQWFNQTQFGTLGKKKSFRPALESFRHATFFFEHLFTNTFKYFFPLFILLKTKSVFCQL